MGIIKDKTLELQRKNPSLDYKDAEYFATRLIAKQSPEHIKARILSKLIQTINNLQVIKTSTKRKPSWDLKEIELEKGVRKLAKLNTFLENGGDI